MGNTTHLILLLNLLTGGLLLYLLLNFRLLALERSKELVKEARALRFGRLGSRSLNLVGE